MSSFPTRKLEIWTSSEAEGLGSLSGVFCFHLVPSIMVPQTLEFLFELKNNPIDSSDILNNFFKGMYYYNSKEPGNLLWWQTFKNHTELFKYDLENLNNAIRQLEIHTDINLTYFEVSYLADIGTGPQKPLMIVKRIPISRGVAFRLEERGLVKESLETGDFVVTDKIKVAQQHYSTGMGMLAGEDSLTGLIDAAFMQFYLAVEALLENHEKDNALKKAKELYADQFNENIKTIIEHVYLARHRFFGHAHPKYLKGILDSDTAFQIAKQTLVARWAARSLMSFEFNRPLVLREMALFPRANHSVKFSGNIESLSQEFALPKPT